MVNNDSNDSETISNEDSENKATEIPKSSSVFSKELESKFEEEPQSANFVNNDNSNSIPKIIREAIASQNNNINNSPEDNNTNEEIKNALQDSSLPSKKAMDTILSIANQDNITTLESKNFIEKGVKHKPSFLKAFNEERESPLQAPGSNTPDLRSVISPNFGSLI